jgi:predicted membrane metal-binding protein
MSASASIPELDAAGLRRFALVTGCIVALLFGLGLPWLLNATVPIWPWVIAGVLAAWGLAAPATLDPLYRGWMRFGLLMNRIVSPLVLGVVFFLIITPAGVVMRVFGRDPLARRLDPSAGTYRVQSRRPGRTSMERPF